MNRNVKNLMPIWKLCLWGKNFILGYFDPEYRILFHAFFVTKSLYGLVENMHGQKLFQFNLRKGRFVFHKCLDIICLKYLEKFFSLATIQFQNWNCEETQSSFSSCKQFCWRREKTSNHTFVGLTFSFHSLLYWTLSSWKCVTQVHQHVRFSRGNVSSFRLSFSY